MRDLLLFLFSDIASISIAIQLIHTYRANLNQDKLEVTQQFVFLFVFILLLTFIPCQ